MGLGGARHAQHASQATPTATYLAGAEHKVASSVAGLAGGDRGAVALGAAYHPGGAAQAVVGHAARASRVEAGVALAGVADVWGLGVHAVLVFPALDPVAARLIWWWWRSWCVQWVWGVGPGSGSTDRRGAVLDWRASFNRHSQLLAGLA